MQHKRYEKPIEPCVVCERCGHALIDTDGRTLCPDCAEDARALEQALFVEWLISVNEQHKRR